MKYIQRTVLSLMLIIAMLCSLTLPALAAQSGAGTELYMNKSLLTQGLTFTNTIYTNPSYGREESFALELAPNSAVTPMVMACDTIYGGLTLSACVAYAESQGYNVVAAVNADYFNSVKVPLGMVVENGVYKSSPAGNPAVAFLPDGKIQVIAQPQVDITLTNHGSDTDAAHNGQSVSLAHFNKTRTATGGMVLYSEAFSTVSTRTVGEGWNVRFKILEGTMTAAGTVELEVTECTEGSEAMSIGEGELILSAHTDSGYRANFEKFSVGDKVTLQTVCNDPILAGAQQVTGCGDILVANGTVTDSAAWDKDIAGVNPRTVLGVKSDGTLLLYVIDGRRTNHSGGVSLSMIANELQALGCQWAVNLDGGGSSVMGVRLPGSESCTVVNSPSDGKERSCGSYLLLVTEAEKSGRPAMLHLQQDGALILAGSSMELSTLATDTALYPASAPNDISIKPQNGTFRDGTYRAPAEAAADEITLRSPTTGASGTGTLHVITEVSGLSVKDEEGHNLNAITLEPGETLQLTPQVYQYGRSVVSTRDAFTYSVEGEVGTITETGLFTAGEKYGQTGSVIIEGGGQRVAIPVKMPVAFSDIRGIWAEPYITALQERGIVSGTSETTFSPDDTIRRGDFMLMLYNAAGRPESTGENIFTDISADAYYTTAVTWAQAQGIAAGMGNGLFDPSGTLTREQSFAFICRALPILNVSFTDGEETVLEPFTDAADLADYARVPAATLIQLQIVSGSGGQLTPKASLTRAQMARILYAALELQTS